MYVKEYFSNTSHTYKYLKRLPNPQGCSTNSGLRAILKLSEVFNSTTLTIFSLIKSNKNYYLLFTPIKLVYINIIPA